jgi:trehalose 6-phosphate synthase/phosphatase
VIHELAFARNAHLRHELAAALDGPDVGLFNGNKIIEIKPQSVNKGTVVKALITQHAANFVFCAGDDYTDEDMFHELPKSAWTVKVGAGDTRAKYQIDSVEDVIDQLERFVEQWSAAAAHHTCKYR